MATYPGAAVAVEVNPRASVPLWAGPSGEQRGGLGDELCDHVVGRLWPGDHGDALAGVDGGGVVPGWAGFCGVVSGACGGVVA